MRLVLCLILLSGLSACGADGAPREPEVSSHTTIGVNSRSGVYSGTEIGIRIGL